MAINITKSTSKETILGEPNELVPGTIIRCGTGNPLETFGLLKSGNHTTGGIYTDEESYFVVLGDIEFYVWQAINGGRQEFGDGAYIPVLRLSMARNQMGKAIQYMPVVLDETKRKESPRFVVTDDCLDEKQLLELQGQFGISVRV